MVDFLSNNLNSAKFTKQNDNFVRIDKNEQILKSHLKFCENVVFLL